MKNCSSRQNKDVGYYSGAGARVRVTNSSSDGDAAGCQVSAGHELIMEYVTLNEVCQSGTLS